jgi:hypothetical protein
LGVTKIETKVARVTVKVTAADVTLPKVALMLVDPAATAVAIPVADNVAHAVLVDTHEHEGDDVTSRVRPSE